MRHPAVLEQDYGSIIKLDGDMGMLKSIPTVKDRAQLPDLHSKNIFCNLSII